MSSKVLKKDNSIIDSKKGNKSLVARNLMNVILYVRQEKNLNHFQVPLVELRNLMNMQNNKAYKTRIEKALKELATPIELRDFTFKGARIDYTVASLLTEPTIYKDDKNYVDIVISEKFVEAVKQKCGYTILEFMKILELGSIFSHEIAQMIYRYKNLPNKIQNDTVRITKSLDELNEIFGTKYKFKSDIDKKLYQAQKEISETLKLEFFYFYDEIDNSFVFTWEKDKEYISSKCRIPRKRIREFALWVAQHTKEHIEDRGKYVSKLIMLIKNDELGNLDAKYQGMLQHKYQLMPEMYYDAERDIYIDHKGVK